MASEVEICNMALSFLGVDTIAALTEDSNEGKLCRLHYPLVRDAVLRAYSWGFAIRRTSLAAVLPAPDYQWLHQYQLPTGPSPLRCLRVLDTEQDESSAKRLWKVEGSKILTNYPAPLNIRYIAQVVDSQAFDPLFVIALSMRMAGFLAANATESAGRIEQSRIAYEAAITEARATDAATGQSGRIRGTLFLESREDSFSG